MAVIKRAQIPAPVLPKETVAVPALGGDVVVRGLLLSERMAVQKKITDLRGADTDAGALAGVHAVLPMVLALCVLDADGAAVFDAPAWQIFGAQHTAAAVELFNTAWRLSGFDAEAETKN